MRTWRYMTIRIAKKVFNEIHVHAEETYPEECCGLLISKGGAASTARDSTKTIIDSIRMRNAYDGPKHDRYNIDPMELFRADRSISQKELAIAGIYHSHPDYPASLSQFDLEHSFPWYSYIIISVPKAHAEDTKSWIPKDDHKSASQESIEVF